VAAGHVFVAMPPLYRIDVGKEVFYALDDAEKQGILDRIQAEKMKGKVTVQRFKGLGEMNPLQLRETTMDPDTRQLARLELDEPEATQDLMDMLLGKKRAGDRRRWLESVAAGASGASGADWVEDSDRYALQVLEMQGEFYPEGVSRSGLSRFDDQVLDLGEGVFERRQAAQRRELARLRRALETEEHPKVRQDLVILIDALEDELRSATLRREALLPYHDLHRLVFGSFNALLDPRNDAERYPAALERLARYTGASGDRPPLTEQARARTQERFDVEGLVGPWVRALETDLANGPRYVAGLRPLFERSGLEGWEAPLAELEAQLDAYAGWVREELLPRARPDSRLPEAVYLDNLRNFGVDMTPEALIAEAQYSYQFIRSEMKALARRIAEQRDWEDADLVAVLRRLKTETIPEDEVLATYQERLREIEAIIRRERIVTLPERDASIRLATEAESAAVPASFMSPPQLIDNTGQYGEFVLVQSNPALGDGAVMDDWNHDAIVWALTVHEARPGHELQFARLVEDGTSLARALFAFNSANVEGWGLYAEAIMHEYLPLEGQLFNLYTRILRAARMFLDPMVNTGRMTRDQAQDFLVEQLALSVPMASSEADRYSFPGPGAGHVVLRGLHEPDAPAHRGGAAPGGRLRSPDVPRHDPGTGAAAAGAAARRGAGPARPGGLSAGTAPARRDRGRSGLRCGTIATGRGKERGGYAHERDRTPRGHRHRRRRCRHLPDQAPRRSRRERHRSSRRRRTSAAPGTGTAIRARASTPRATPTATPSPGSCSTNGTGRSASRPSRRTCATSTSWPTSSICEAHAVQLPRRAGCVPGTRTRRLWHLGLADGRDADEPLRDPGYRPAVHAHDAAAIEGIGDFRGPSFHTYNWPHEPVDLEGQARRRRGHRRHGHPGDQRDRRQGR
jgi:hypothetical protein